MRISENKTSVQMIRIPEYSSLVVDPDNNSPIMLRFVESASLVPYRVAPAAFRIDIMPGIYYRVTKDNARSRMHA